jgi:hypothetical protein
MKVSNAWKHFKTICKHKYWVGHYCFKAGIPWRGITHDLSKFSPIEFWESVKYYQGTSSPIDACKKANGWSKAWLHHKGRNDHHYEYWQDNFDKGGEALLMPKECAIELVCDYLGAGRAYMGKEFTYASEYKWWAAKRSNPLAMHPKIKEFIEYVLQSCWADETVGNEPNLKMLGDLYEIIVLNQ